MSNLTWLDGLNMAGLPCPSGEVISIINSAFKNKSLFYIPVRIRPDTTVSISNIPYDLTREEAEKIIQTILEYARVDK